MEDWNESLKGSDVREKKKVQQKCESILKRPSHTIAFPNTEGKDEIYHISSDLNKSNKLKVNISMCKGS